MLTCRSCNSADVVVENYHKICTSCGNILDNSYLSETEPQSILCSTFASFQDEYKGRAYGAFQFLYHSCVLTLNPPNGIRNEGLQMLPKLWNNTKLKHHKNKRNTIFALLFLLYRSHNLPMIGTLFKKKAMFDCRSFGKAITFVTKLFDFPSSLHVDFLGMIKSKTHELAGHIFKKSKPSLEKTVSCYAVRLAQVIHDQEWGNQQSKNYVSFVSTAAIIISGQFTIISDNDLKKYAPQRHTSFRVTQKGTLNYKKVAKEVSLNVRVVQNFVKKVQCELFEVAKKIPWKPTFLTASNQVGLILNDILDFVELDIKEELDIDETSQASTSTVDCLHHKLAIISAISRYVDCNQTHVDGNIDNIWMKEKQFVQILEEELKNNSSSEKKDNTDAYQIFFEEDFLKIGDCYYGHGFFNVLKDLFKAGCPLEEILRDDYIALVRKYLNWDNEEDDMELEPLSNEESILYLRDVDLVSDDEDDVIYETE